MGREADRKRRLPLVRRGRPRKQIAHLQAEGLDDLLGRASRAAEEEDTAVLSLLYVEVRGYPASCAGQKAR